MSNKYIGLTYPKIFEFKLIRQYWQKYFCPRKMHLFDEVLSEEHYLYCDACHFVLYIDDNKNHGIIRGLPILDLAR